jgi:outer membrane protein assembly factor BamB
LKTQWSEAIPLTWERTIGSAYSSFAVVGNRLYTCGTKQDRQILVCLDADKGDVLWETPIEKEYRDQHGSGARATPTIDGDRVYILGAHGRFLCADSNTGKEIWSKEFHNKPTWGYSASVLIEGDLAITTAGKNEGALVALHKTSGDEAWKCGDDLAGYSTPYPFDFGGKRYVVGVTGQSVIIVDSKTGKPATQISWKTAWDVNAAAPIFHDGHLFITSGYDTGSALFKLTAESDTLNASEVWKSEVMLSKFQSSVLHQGKLYASDQDAFKCVDFMTGQEHWKKRKIRNGTVVLADGYLYLLTEDGKLQIGKASAADFTPDTTATVLSDRCWTVPVLHKGRLYARNLDRVVCFNLAG